MQRICMITVLLIEDSTLMRKTVKESLRNFNILFIDAADGTAGLKMAKLRQPDLILLDLNLPDMNGLEVLKLLKVEKLSAAIPVIMSTTSSNLADVEKAVKAGAQDYMVKPMEPSKLLHRICKVLSLKEEELSSLCLEKPKTESEAAL